MVRGASAADRGWVILSTGPSRRRSRGRLRFTDNGHKVATHPLVSYAVGAIAQCSYLEDRKVRSLLEERFDVAVCAAALRTRSVMAVTVKERVRGGASVVMNTEFVNYRKRPLVGRVNLAHELAHVLFDAENDEVNMIVVDRVDPRDAHGGTAIEQRARAFAAELLIPVLGLSSRFGEPAGITEPSVADALVDDARGLFLTPAEITVNHLVNRGYIADDEALREDLIRSAAMRNPVDTQALAPVIPPEGVRSTALLERVERAHDRGLLTDGRARELLALAGGERLPWDAQRFYAFTARVAMNTGMNVESRSPSTCRSS
jgi:IrrE N-terminal-like domain